jgi:hypothetical protein
MSEFEGQSGKHMLALSSSQFDPEPTSDQRTAMFLKWSKVTIPMGGEVLACFDPWWPSLKIAVACFAV